MSRQPNIRTDYRGWKFRDKVPLISKDSLWKAYFEDKFANIDVDVDFDEDKIIQTITDTINENLDNLDLGLEQDFQELHRHIEESKEHLCCDICCAKNNIKQHIDNKIDPINFEEKFSNLNEQAELILQKLNSI